MSYKSKFSGDTVDDNIDIVKNNYNYWDSKESSLGSPPSDDYVLMSKANGTRFWSQGGLPPGDQQKLDYITVTQPINLDNIANISGDFVVKEYIAVTGQTSITVANEIFSLAGVYINGIRVPGTKYSITDNGTDTTIIFTYSLINNETITIEFVRTNRRIYEFIANTNQSSFIVNNDIFISAGVFVDGLRTRTTEYTISNNGTDTTLTFNTGKAINTWILIDIKG